MGRDRNDSGRYSDRIPPEAVLDVFDELEDSARPLTASDVVDDLDIARRTAHNKLNALVERGVLETRKVGARGRVWWVPHIDSNDVDSAGASAVKGNIETSLDEDLPNEHVGEDAGTPTPSGTSERRETSEDGRELAEAISQVDTPGSGETREKREQALRETYEYLRAEGTARRSDFEDLLGDDVGYSGGFRSWWTNYVKAKDALKQLPNVDAPAEGEHTWTYTGDTDPVEDSGIYDPTEEFDQ